MNINQELKKEREKLKQLAREALKSDSLIKQKRALMEQCSKIKRLVLIQKLENLLDDEDALREKLLCYALYAWMEKDRGEG